MWCQTPTRPSLLGRPVGAEKYQRPLRSWPSKTRWSPSRRKPMNSAKGIIASIVVYERAPSMPRMRCSAGMSSASATSGVSLVSETLSSTSWPPGARSTRRVACGGDHQLDLVALRVVEDDALRLGGVEAQQLAEDVVGDEAVHPELERVVGRDAQDQAVDVAVAGHAGRRLLELEEGHDAAGVAVLVAEVRVVAERRLVVERVLDEPQAHHAAPEVDVRLDVGRDAREVVWPTERLHRISSSSLP